MGQVRNEDVFCFSSINEPKTGSKSEPVPRPAGAQRPVVETSPALSYPMFFQVLFAITRLGRSPRKKVCQSAPLTVRF